MCADKWCHYMCAENCCHPGMWRDDVIQVCRLFTISGSQYQTPGLSELVETLSSSPSPTCFAGEDKEILGWRGLALGDSDSDGQYLHQVS